jgi:hypothetical protein
MTSLKVFTFFWSRVLIYILRAVAAVALSFCVGNLKPIPGIVSLFENDIVNHKRPFLHDAFIAVHPDGDGG